MITRYKKCHILILENIFIRDIQSMKDLMVARANNLTITNIAHVNETKLPKKFESLETWVKHIDVNCWHCSLKLQKNRIPVALPLNYTKSSNQLIMDVEGIFCSFPCAMAYAKYKYKTLSKIKEKSDLLCTLFRYFYSEIIYNIPCAPDRQDMKQYCGSIGITIEQYRQTVLELDPGSKHEKKMKTVLCDEDKLQNIIMRGKQKNGYAAFSGSGYF